MSKKATSNRTVARPWRTVYRGLVGRARGWITTMKQWLEARPRGVFFAMVFGIMGSLVCVFYLPREAPVSDPSPLTVPAALSDGMGAVLTSVSTFKELLELRAFLDELVEKDSLDSSDSVLMGQAIDRLQILEKKLADADKHHHSP